MIKRTKRITTLSAMSLAATLTMLGQAGSVTYEIRPFQSVHETMTRLAEECVDSTDFSASDAGSPTICSTDGIEDARKRDHIWRLITFRRNFTKQQNASRWSDLPVSPGLTGSLRAARDLREGCEKAYIKAIAKQSEILPGLICHSHNGQLQFLHAMSSKETVAGGAAETVSETHDKILDWSRFTYRVASGKVSPTANYCTTAGRYEAISSDLLSVIDPDWCEDRVVEDDSFSAWRAHTLFNFKCRRLDDWSTCKEVLGQKGAEMARRNARGALLHMIQDSYSTSHTLREGGKVGEYVPKAICGPIVSYYDYNVQVGEELGGRLQHEHSNADTIPTFDCDPSSLIHDPITASAHAIWFLEQSDDQEDALIEYIERHVLGTRSKQRDPI